jgi:hypothetical protein
MKLVRTTKTTTYLALMAVWAAAMTAFVLLGGWR